MSKQEKTDPFRVLCADAFDHECEFIAEGKDIEEAVVALVGHAKDQHHELHVAGVPPWETPAFHKAVMAKVASMHRY